MGEGRGERRGKEMRGRFQRVNFQHSIVQVMMDTYMMSHSKVWCQVYAHWLHLFNHSYHQIIIIAYSNEGKERGEDQRGGAYLWFVKNCNL